MIHTGTISSESSFRWFHWFGHLWPAWPVKIFLWSNIALCKKNDFGRSDTASVRISKNNFVTNRSFISWASLNVGTFEQCYMYFEYSYWILQGRFTLFTTFLIYSTRHCCWQLNIQVGSILNRFRLVYASFKLNRGIPVQLTFEFGRYQKCEVILSSIQDFWINGSPPVGEFGSLVHGKVFTTALESRF